MTRCWRGRLAGRCRRGDSCAQVGGQGCRAVRVHAWLLRASRPQSQQWHFEVTMQNIEWGKHINTVQRCGCGHCTQVLRGGNSTSSRAPVADTHRRPKRAFAELCVYSPAFYYARCDRTWRRRNYLAAFSTAVDSGALNVQTCSRKGVLDVYKAARTPERAELSSDGFPGPRLGAIET